MLPSFESRAAFYNMSPDNVNWDTLNPNALSGFDILNNVGKLFGVSTHNNAALDIINNSYSGTAPSSAIEKNNSDPLTSIQEDPQNQSITDSANSDENQEFWQGLAQSIGEQQKQQMSYNERMTKMLMDWTTEMSNTAYQRAMNDMKKAGLNPILAYNQGGASTPSVTPSSYSLGGGDSLSDFVNMITNGASNILKVIANFLPSGQSAKLLEVAKEITYDKGVTHSVTKNVYG